MNAMEVQIKAIHFDISDRLAAFINKKIDRLARRFESITLFEVTLKVVKPETAMNKEASVRLTMPGAPEMYASKTASTFEEAIDGCLEALEKPLEKSKGRN